MRQRLWRWISKRGAILVGLGIVGFLVASSFVGARQTSDGSKLRFELSFPESVKAGATDGRLFVIIARTEAPEPRLQIRSYDSTPFFGLNIDGLKPGQTAVVDNVAYGYPFE